MKNFHVRRRAVWTVMSLLLAIAGCGADTGTNGGDDDDDPPGGGGNPGGGGPTMTMAVTVGDNFFDPSAIQVSPGATVTWTWSSNVVHNVTFADNAIADSGNQGGGDFATAMPMTPGTYAYDCTIHSGMDGSVLVQ